MAAAPDADRASDRAARHGGEEFALVLPGADAAQAGARCETLRAAIAAHDWRAPGAALRVTVSIKVATQGAAQDDDPGSNPAALLAAAGARLYEAKRSGKNAVRS